MYLRIHINDCGQMVFFRQSRESLPSEVYFYDNGTLVEIGDGPKNNQFPDLNDLGDISWSRDQTIVLLKRSGELIEIGGGTSHSLNNLGHLAFKGGSQFFDGNTVISIEQPGDGSMQSVDLNDLDEMVWTHYHSGGSDINLYQNGVVTVLPSLSQNSQGADLNKKTRVVWGALGGIEFWNGNQTVTIDDGRTTSPAVNDNDDIAYLVRPPPGGEVLTMSMVKKFLSTSLIAGLALVSPGLGCYEALAQVTPFSIPQPLPATSVFVPVSSPSEFESVQNPGMSPFLD
ncbi:MAG: hypothetical protein IH989_00480, partial [Planctomycetes bacterium]|nr:hypothetical protein [Planctomycetota bacterium]